MPDLILDPDVYAFCQATTLAGMRAALALDTGNSPTFTAGTFSGTTSLLLGTAGSAVGNVGFRNATSGTATLAPPTGALGTYTITLPNAASTLPIFGQQITFTGPTAARSYALPDANSTLATLAGTETFTNKTLTSPTLTTPDLGTPASGTLTNCTGLPQAGTVGLTTADSPQFTAVNVGNASDTTLSRSAAAILAVEGNVIFAANTKTDILQAGQFAADAGANDTYVITLSPAITAYVTGTHYRFKANTANTGSATLNVNAVGAVTIKKAAGGITTDLDNNDIRAGQWVDVVYDGTNFQMQSLLGNTAAAGAGDVTASSSFGTDNVLVRSDGTGKGVQSSGIACDDSNNLTGITSVSATTLSVTGQINDTNSNELIKFTATASAVNEWTLANAATGANPTLTASGGDTDVGLDFLVKGAGKYNFKASASGPAEIRLFEDSDNGSNYAGLIAPASMASNLTITLPNASSTLPIFPQQVTISGPTAARTWTVTDADMTIVGTSTTQTLTNKTLTSANITTKLAPTTDDGAPLGDTTHHFSDLFLATGAVINFQNGNAAITHSSGIITVSTGDLRVTSANVGTNADSIPTLSSTSTLTNKTLTSPTLTTPALGTPASGTLTNCTGLPVAGITASTSTALGVGSIELGHASDTSITRVSAGQIAVEGVNIGYLELQQNSKSAAYTTVLADSGKHILHPSADTTARTFTIDSNANVAYPIGTAITFVNQNSGGVVTIAITSDTMRLAGAGTTGSRTLAANGIATALKITSTEWIISGTGLT